MARIAGNSPDDVPGLADKAIMFRAISDEIVRSHSEHIAAYHADHLLTDEDVARRLFAFIDRQVERRFARMQPPEAWAKALCKVVAEMLDERVSALQAPRPRRKTERVS